MACSAKGASARNLSAVGAFKAALSAIEGVGDLADGLQYAISIGGDTGAVAAIAGSLLGALYGAEALMPKWRDELHGWPGAYRRTCFVLPETCTGAAGAAGGGLRFGGELVAGCSPGSGRGCRADGARACAVLAGDVSGTDVGRSARRPRLPGRSGAVLDCRVDRRALSRESRGCRRTGRRADRDRHVRPALGCRSGVGEAAVCALCICRRPRHRCWTGAAGGGRGSGGAGGAVGRRPEPSCTGVLPQARLRCRRGGPGRGRSAGDPHGPRQAAQAVLQFSGRLPPGAVAWTGLSGTSSAVAA